MSGPENVIGHAWMLVAETKWEGLDAMARAKFADNCWDVYGGLWDLIAVCCGPREHRPLIGEVISTLEAIQRNIQPVNAEGMIV